MVKSKIDIDKNINFKNFKVVDARSITTDLKGIVPEPRSNVKSGSIEGSTCLPFNQLLIKIITLLKITMN